MAANPRTAFKLCSDAALAAWICHLRGHGVPVADPRGTAAVEAAGGPIGEAVPRVLGMLDSGCPTTRESSPW